MVCGSGERFVEERDWNSIFSVYSSATPYAVEVFFYKFRSGSSLLSAHISLTIF